jgi:hypothetical protein
MRIPRPGRHPTRYGGTANVCSPFQIASAGGAVRTAQHRCRHVEITSNVEVRAHPVLMKQAPKSATGLKNICARVRREA